MKGIESVTMQQNKERLEELRQALQNKLKANAYFDEQIAPYRDVLSSLQKAAVVYKIQNLIGVEKVWLPYLQEKLREAPYTLPTTNLSTTEGVAILDQLFTLYPSQNALRYVPPLPKIANTQDLTPGLKKTIANLDLKNQTVYLCHLRFAPLLQLQLYDLMLVESEGLFNLSLGDTVIFPKDLKWLIAYSLEEEWYVGKLTEKIPK